MHAHARTHTHTSCSLGKSRGSRTQGSWRPLCLQLMPERVCVQGQELVKGQCLENRASTPSLDGHSPSSCWSECTWDFLNLPHSLVRKAVLSHFTAETTEGGARHTASKPRQGPRHPNTPKLPTHNFERTSRGHTRPPESQM